MVGIGAGLELGKQALLGFERGLSNVIDAIPDLIHQGQEFALLTDDIADKTGASAESASRFAGSLQYLGISTAGLGMSLKTLSDDIVNNEAKLNKLGIVTRDANGDLLDTITVLDSVRSYLSGAADGAAKLTLASDLLGRGAGTLVDYLNLTDEQAAALNSTLDDLGVTMGEDARHNAEDLARETNLLGVAWQGFANMLFTEVAPTIRAVIAGITEFIKEHGAEIRETIVSMTQAVLGFVSGLIGAEGLTPFQDQLDGLGNAAGGVALSFDQWAQQTGRTIPAQEKLKTATKGTTDAIDKQIASTQKAIDTEKARDDASETVFQRTMKRLSAEYGAQLDALDLADRQAANAQRDKDLAKSLFEAQAQLRADALGGKDTGQSTQDVAAAQKAIIDERAKRENDAQRARLTATQSYIEDIAKLEADSENKKALAANLGTRRTTLEGQLQVATAAKDADAIADITAKLEAIKTAEERTAQAQRSRAKQDELAGLKTQLENQRKAIAAAGQGQVTDNKKTLGDLKKQYNAYLAEQQQSTLTNLHDIEHAYAGDAGAGTGLGGAITKAFTDGQAAGEALNRFLLEDLLPAFAAVLDVIGQIAGIVGKIIDSLHSIQEVRDAVADAVGRATAIGHLKAPKGASGIPKSKWGMTQDSGGGTSGGGTFGPKPGKSGLGAFGMVIPGEGSTVIPSLQSASALSGAAGQPVVLSIEAGGNKLLDYFNENLYYRRRR